MRFEEDSKGTRAIHRKMYVLPIFVRKLVHSSLLQAWMFLERNGTYLIEIPDEPSAIEFAEENGLILSEEVAPFVKGDVIYIIVDTNTINFNDFYTWSEVSPGTTPPKELWRPFLWSKEDASMNRYLSEISIGSEGNHTVFSCLEEFFKKTNSL